MGPGAPLKLVALLLLAAACHGSSGAQRPDAGPACVQGVASWWTRTKRMPKEALADYLLALTWRGFDGLPRHPTPFRPGSSTA